jgi:hypothetical protein
MPSVHGEDAVIRILDKESMSEQFTELRLDILGWPDIEMKRFRKFIREPYGMVLVTGPTGSGKTTTLYAALSEIKTVEDKIITIEDPVEYQLRGITQIPINEKKGLTFARGLRSILRHDPDTIMVGEIRDPETAQIAIQSALTGHLVFTTVHANNVIDVLGRFLNMGVEPYQFVAALNCVLAQRLVRRILFGRLFAKLNRLPTEIFFNHFRKQTVTVRIQMDPVIGDRPVSRFWIPVKQRDERETAVVCDFSNGGAVKRKLVIMFFRIGKRCWKCLVTHWAEQNKAHFFFTGNSLNRVNQFAQILLEFGDTFFSGK